MNKEKFWQTIESVNRLVPDGDHEMVQEQMRKEAAPLFSAGHSGLSPHFAGI